MGLFSKSITRVGTSVSRVIEDKLVPDSVKTGTLKSLLSDDNQLTENIIEELAASIGTRAGRMYDYGKSKYSFGLPSGTLVTSTDAKSKVKTIIESQVGNTITLDYYHFGSLNNTHYGWFILYRDYGYNPVSNQIASISATKGTPVYLKNMQVVVNDATLEELGNGSLDQWGTSPSAGFTPEQPYITPSTGNLKDQPPFLVDNSAAQDYIKVAYVWEETQNVLVEGVTVARKVIKEGSLTFLVESYDTQADWHQTKYSYGSGATKGIGYWLYESGLGNYPDIDSVFSEDYAGIGTFFPFTYFRFDKKATNDNPSSDEYKTSKKLVGYLNMDFDEVVGAINENPDIKDVEQAMLMFAVPANTTNPLEQRYLYDFFKNLYIEGGGNDIGVSVEGEKLASALGIQQPEASIIIQDKRFKMALTYRNIVTRSVKGIIGKVGFHSSGYSIDITIKDGKDIDTGATYKWESKVPCNFYRKQVSGDYYDEVLVFNLKTVYHIFENYTAIGDETDAILLVPIDKGITSKYSTPDKEILYSRSLHYVFNSKVVTKLKWYQTSIFKVIVIIIAIIVTVLTYGSTAQALAAAIAAGAVGAASIIILNIVLDYLIFKVLFKLFVKAVGGEFALVLAVVLAAVGGFQALQAGSIAGAPWAQELLQASSGLTGGISEQLKDDFNTLIEEQEAFSSFTKKELEKLNTANNLLEDSSKLSPFIIFGESPSDFYQRTVHSGNIGILSIDAISSYVSTSLTLPKLNETVGETIYDH